MPRALLLVLAALLLATCAPSALAHPEPGDRDGDEVFEGPNPGGRPYPDNCTLARNGDQADADADGQGNACDEDDDADGVADRQGTEGEVRPLDNCRLVPNPGQEDADRDGVGDPCDVDEDADGVPDGRDNCPGLANPDQRNTDADERGDPCDADDDDDAIADGRDNCPTAENFGQRDDDGDGRGTLCDPGERPRSGGQAGADRAAPAVALRFARLQRAHDLAGGMRVGATCSEACALTGELRLDRATARRLGLRGPVLARGTATLGDDGRTWLFLRASAATRRKLFAPRAGRVTATLAVEAVDAAQNERRVVRTVSLRR